MLRNYLSSTCLLACFVSATVGDKAIINGVKAINDNELPYQVIVQVHGWWWENCGGGIISNQFILTAAQCTYNRDRPRSRITVVAGTIDLNRTHSPAVTREVKKVYVPKEYVYDTVSSYGDIAVLELREPLGLTEHSSNMRPLHPPLKETNSIYIGRTVTIAGFGFQSVEPLDQFHQHSSHHSNSRLRIAKQHVINSTLCRRIHHEVDVHDKLICTEASKVDRTPSGVCYGDAGGPLVLNDKKTIIGILSQIPDTCIPTIPSIYTSVLHYMDFIVRAMRGGDKEIMNIHTLSN